MIEAVEVVSYGSAAGEALAKAVARAKAGRALAPVTVVVPSHLAGLSARRRLGSDGGVANVSFLTARDLAGRLAGDLALDRPPLSGAASVLPFERRCAPIRVRSPRYATTLRPRPR